MTFDYKIELSNKSFMIQKEKLKKKCYIRKYNKNKELETYSHLGEFNFKSSKFQKNIYKTYGLESGKHTYIHIVWAQDSFTLVMQTISNTYIHICINI